MSGGRAGVQSVVSTAVERWKAVIFSISLSLSLSLSVSGLIMFAVSLAMTLEMKERVRFARHSRATRR